MAIVMQNHDYGFMGISSIYNQDQRKINGITKSRDPRSSNHQEQTVTKSILKPRDPRSSYNQGKSVIKRIMKPRDPRPCPHLWLVDYSCLNCGKRLHNHQLRTMPYVKISKKVDSDKICNSISVENKVKVQNPKKIYLVLDLDHTLVNSTPLDSLSSDEEYLKSISDKDCLKRGLYRLDHIRIVTKLRPFVRTFLEEASKMFEMYIYTMGDRAYALEMAKLLDPENKYFNSRIISRDDCELKHQKGLEILRKPENEVLILDDTRCVWPKNKDNLIVMERYMYFSSGFRQFGYNGKSLAELKRDEDGLDGALSSVLQVLKRIHGDFNDSNGSISKDVRNLLKDSRKKILKGCNIVFSGVFPKNYEGKNHELWKMAEELGANCEINVESSVTHVVSIDGGTEKSRWGIEQGKFVVHPRWIEASYYLWRRQLEDNFKLNVHPPILNL